MKQEIKRGMDSLKIEKMLAPIFISYSISDAKTLQIEAILGGIVKSEERPARLFENRVLVVKTGRPTKITWMKIICGHGVASVMNPFFRQCK